MNYADAGYVYAIQNTVNGGMYIGSTTAFKSRWHTHKSALRRGVHHSFVLQRAWDKHGEASFVFKLLVVCPKNQRIDYENRLMSLQRYNVLRTALESSVRGGWQHSEEFKARLSAIHKGKTLSPEHRQKISTATVGRKYGPKFKETARQRQLGVSPSAITRSKLSESTRAARAAQRNSNLIAAQRMYEAVVSGTPLSEVFVSAKMSRTTFYNCCKALGLAPLKRKRGRT